MKIFKRTLSALLALVMVIGMVPMPVAAEESVAASGDVDGNSKIQTNDAKLILQRYTDIINAYPSESAGSDVDGNGVDNSIDASLILQYISKMIDTLPVDKNLAEAVPEDLPAKTPDSATSFTASAGETISVPFSVTNNPGFMCYGLTLQYDTDALILEAVNESAHAGGFLFVENTNNGKISYAGSSDITDDGDLFTATFRVSSDAADGSYEIVANLDEASTANETCEYVSLDITGVTVTVNQPPRSAPTNGVTGQKTQPVHAISRPLQRELAYCAVPPRLLRVSSVGMFMRMVLAHPVDETLQITQSNTVTALQFPSLFRIIQALYLMD